MKSDQGYKGKIVFYKNVDTDTIVCSTDDGWYIDYIKKSEDKIYLAEAEVDVTFQDARQEETA